METENYIPGTCNIGAEQLTKRKRFAFKSVLGTILCLFFLQAFHLDKIWRLLMVVPFAVTSVALQQVAYKFCYVFGLKGLYGFGEIDKANKIKEDEFRKKDRRKSQLMLISSLLIGIILSVAYYFLPL